MASSKLLYKDKMLPSTFPQKRRLLDGNGPDFQAFQLTNDRRVFFSSSSLPFPIFMLDLINV